MHIYVGGSHNGKRDFVKERLAGEDCVWIEAGGLDRLPDPPRGIVILAGIEEYISKVHTDEREAVGEVREFVRAAEPGGLVLIITDIGRGIVPADPHARWLRDTCGRLNQQLFREADRITRIWYGIPQEIR
ncbi:bifunctional adenosylcobinamide kinase/adenosylcobinamide-phosphate guanylyltransferase [Bhargavaea cecembensis]|uniref:bifunctional adenosylcobinamide kinase/adenosylcobinamide-phosphate guanylyltransferase n=1 Tax=Bhargavaea cecembensis TaxID=394098 RepID=UPI00058AD7E0|nr:bifunctional adenosylcobinamide kinase/adenosylcobinamide-phosphate guanylyltransferase [Bhargavaea cecembensis]